MQPYFIPYAGYFRLLATTDLFVLYDCVQFPRRGWVHRNRLPDASGQPQWLTLPLAPAPQSVRIDGLTFQANAHEVLAARLRRFPLLRAVPDRARTVMRALRDVGGSPVDYLERLLHAVADHLGLPWRVVRSSTLALPESLRGQQRVLAIARHFDASCYVNAPGGRALYDSVAFAAAGMRLRFLPDYQGSSASILHRILTEDPAALADDITSSSDPLP